ncbi:MAG: Thiol:disulfide interchange protein DsbD precursor [Elusimicrobia bacterium ADurb.Bin231]|nr:MAG: Thiol:disulfide interchange protein DsbD precursor [Elusimicrobia bacterium ADurb.Bin231]
MMDLGNIMSSYLSGNNPASFIFAFIGGVITSFTPCVFPVIPVIVGYIGASHVKSRSEAFLLSVFYVIGLALTFSVLGLVASYTGMIFGSIQSNPWSYIFMGTVVLIMTLYFLNILRIPLPNLNIPRFKQRGYISALLLGAFSGIITAPCTAAILAILLAYVGTKQNVVFGGLLLFTYALGLGCILVIAGTFTGTIKIIIKSSFVAEKIKIGFAVVLFIMAVLFYIKAYKLF